jgi:DNA-binding SARP family transcriptional activator
VTGALYGAAWGYVGAGLAQTKVQLCGRLAVVVEGRRVDAELPGRQGRLLFAYLALHRLRPVERAELLEALWPDGRDVGLAPLLSKLRRVVPLEGTRLALDDPWIDVEAASDALHRAESALAQSDPYHAWGPSQVAMFTSGRTFLAGEEAPWIDEERRRLGELHLRALEAYAACALAIRGTELPAAVRAGRELTRLEPYRESGWRILMHALAAEGNPAEALLAYERLRTLLRDELDVAPSAATQALRRGRLG